MVERDADLVAGRRKLDLDVGLAFALGLPNGADVFAFAHPGDVVELALEGLLHFLDRRCDGLGAADVIALGAAVLLHTADALFVLHPNGRRPPNRLGASVAAHDPDGRIAASVSDFCVRLDGFGPLVKGLPGRGFARLVGDGKVGF